MKSSHLSRSDAAAELARVLLGALALLIGSAAIGIAVNHFSPRGIPVFPVGQELAAAQAFTVSIPLPPGLKPVGLADAKKAFDDAAALFLDARPSDEYAEAHVPGAVNLPPSRFEERFPDLADRVEKAPIIIVYCSGAECSDSIEVAERLEEAGNYTIQVLEAGWRAWAEAGYPTTTGAEP
jgi:rhodanese-related sulfurtransferase